MQILSHTYELNNILDNKSGSVNDFDLLLLNEWNKLRELLEANCT